MRDCQTLAERGGKVKGQVGRAGAVLPAPVAAAMGLG